MKRASTRRFRCSVFPLLLMPVFAACQSLSPHMAADLEHLQGSWQGRGPGSECSVTISGNSLIYTQPSADSERPAFWFETTFELVESTGPKQLHATIVKNHDDVHLGTVVVTIFKFEDDKLTLGVVQDFEEPPTEPIVGDWDWVRDQFDLEKVEPSEDETLRDRSAT